MYVDSCSRNMQLLLRLFFYSLWFVQVILNFNIVKPKELQWGGNNGGVEECIHRVWSEKHLQDREGNGEDSIEIGLKELNCECEGK
jgi:hypothetical protein